jgi:hypothetical protein
MVDNGMILKFIVLNKIIYDSFPSKYNLISEGINNKLYTSVHRKRVAGVIHCDNSENKCVCWGGGGCGRRTLVLNYYGFVIFLMALEAEVTIVA